VTPFTRPSAVDQRGAAALAGSRRVLVTGFVGAPPEVVVAACDLAETIGAAIDAGDPDLARAAGPTIARVGEVTADREELRDRADLVVLWCCDPDAVEPGFPKRFIMPPLPGDTARRVFAVGREPAGGMAADVVHLPLDPVHAVDAARALECLHGGLEPQHLADPVAAVCRGLHSAITEARCVAFVTAHDGAAEGLEPWSIVRLVRALSHHRPAFEVPLGAERFASFRACCTWRYGAAGGIARADRTGAVFLPAEATAGRLLARGEVDAVVVVGTATAEVETAIAQAADRLAVVRIAAGLTATMRAEIEALGATFQAGDVPHGGRA